VPQEDPNASLGYEMYNSSDSEEDDKKTDSKHRPSVNNNIFSTKRIERLTTVKYEDRKEIDDVNYEEKKKFYAISISNLIFYTIQMFTVLLT
jgi:hypothetical protein